MGMCITLIALFSTFHEMSSRKRLLTLSEPKLKEFMKMIEGLPHANNITSDDNMKKAGSALNRFLDDNVMKQLSYTQFDLHRIQLTGPEVHEDVLYFGNSNHVDSLIAYLKKKGVQGKDYVDPSANDGWRWRGR